MEERILHQILDGVHVGDRRRRFVGFWWPLYGVPLPLNGGGDPFKKLDLSPATMSMKLWGDGAWVFVWPLTGLLLIGGSVLEYGNTKKPPDIWSSHAHPYTPSIIYLKMQSTYSDYKSVDKVSITRSQRLFCVSIFHWLFNFKTTISGTKKFQDSNFSQLPF